MSESMKNAALLKVRFYCQYADDFEINIELVDSNRVEGLQSAWNKAIEHYCPSETQKMQKQLKRKLGSIYTFYDQLAIVLCFVNADGKRDEVRVTATMT